MRRHPAKPDRHEIVAGERRWRAAQLAGLHEVPVLERALSDREVLEMALVENVQRRDLSALEEAEGYQRLIAEFGRSQEDLARRSARAASMSPTRCGCLKLPEEAKAMLRRGQHHRRPWPRPDRPPRIPWRWRAGWWRRICRSVGPRPWRLSADTARRPRKPAAPKDADTRALERDLGRALGLEVEIAHGGAGGRVTIRYRSLEQLDEVVRRLNG